MSDSHTFSAADWTAKSRCVIRPSDENKPLRYWETFSGLLLVVVCFCTPYEVGFVDSEIDVRNPFFVLNRLIDLTFICDMVLQFFVMPVVKHRYGILYVFDHKAIIKRYIRGWFCVDLVSVLPFELLGLLLKSDSLGRLRLLRILRLLKLLKLARLIRGMRIFKRWEVAIGFSYRRLTLFQFMLGVFISAHWMACALGMATMTQYEDCADEGVSKNDCVTWVQTLYPYSDESGTMAVYIMALHIAVTILVHPHANEPTNIGESIGFMALTFIGGFIWTDVISRSTSISTSLGRHNMVYHQTMDDLNTIGNDLSIPKDLHRRLRQFFVNTKDYSERECWKHIEDRMSPQLRGELAYELNRAWWRRVPYLSKCSKDMRIACSETMGQVAFAQGEQFGTPFTMYILNRGLVGKGVGTQALYFRFAGAVWGEEHLLLNHWWLLEPTTCCAFTFSEVLTLTRESFTKIASEHPENTKFLRKAYLKILLLRGLQWEVRQRSLAANEGWALALEAGKSATYVKAQSMIKKGLESRGVSEPSTPMTPMDARGPSRQSSKSSALLEFNLRGIKRHYTGNEGGLETGALDEERLAALRKSVCDPEDVTLTTVSETHLNSQVLEGSSISSGERVAAVPPPRAPDESKMARWRRVEDRIEQYFVKLHGELVSKLEQRGEQLEAQLDTVLDTFPIADQATATHEIATEWQGRCGAVWRCRQGIVTRNAPAGLPGHTGGEAGPSK